MRSFLLVPLPLWQESESRASFPASFFFLFLLFNVPRARQSVLRLTLVAARGFDLPPAAFFSLFGQLLSFIPSFL